MAILTTLALKSKPRSAIERRALWLDEDAACELVGVPFIKEPRATEPTVADAQQAI